MKVDMRYNSCSCLAQTSCALGDSYDTLDLLRLSLESLEVQTLITVIDTLSSLTWGHLKITENYLYRVKLGKP